MLWVAATLLHGIPTGAPTTLEAAQSDYARIAGEGTATAFALALLASGFASASVGTFSGQIVMEEFTSRRIPILLRRAITVLPALVVLGIGIDPTAALVGSQVVLSFGIPFALVPLVRFTSDFKLMGQWTVGTGTKLAASAVALLIIVLNAFLIGSVIAG
jgi:manganese transport protein